MSIKVEEAYRDNCGAETNLRATGSDAMNGKIAVVLLSGLLFACAPTEPPAASAPPPPPPAPAPAAEAMPVDRFVSIQRASCEDLMKLSPDDRAAASMFYIGYQSSRRRAASINVPTI